MKIGDKVKVAEPFNGFACKVYGTIISFYGPDRVIIETKAGNTWALEQKQVEIIKKARKEDVDLLS